MPHHWDDQIQNAPDSGYLHAYAFGVVRGMMKILQVGQTDASTMVTRFFELSEAVDKRMTTLEFEAAEAAVARHRSHILAIDASPEVDQAAIYEDGAALGDEETKE